MKRHETIINLDELDYHEWNSGGAEDETLRYILREGEGEVDYWEDER